MVALIGSSLSLLAQTPPVFKDKTDSLSYALGMDLGRNLSNTPFEFNMEALYQGLVDKTKGGATKLDDQQMQQILVAFQQELQVAMREKAMKAASENKAKGEAFLAENKTKEGVVATPSGLQYQVLKQGSGGAKPTATSTVKAGYEGRLLDGTVFDGSERAGGPIEFQLNGVIRGWTEGLQLMSVGDKFRFWIPYNLGYGERGSPPKIGPNETLVFDVELFEIK